MTTTLNETSKTSATVLFTGAPTPTRFNPERRRKEEIFAWFVIAAIWGMFALSLCLLWAKTLGGV